MNDSRDLLRRAVESELPTTGLERVRASLVRRRRRQRVTAGGLAFLIALAGVGLAIRAFGGSSSHDGQPADETPTEVGPLDVSTLEPSWSVEVPTGVGLFPVVADSERVYVPTTSGVVAYAKACKDPCAPLWTLELGDVAPGQRDHAEVAVGDGVVVIARGGRLAVAPVDCAAVCHPLWTATLQGDGSGGPLISNGVVKWTSSEGEGGDQHVTAVAFPVDCRTDGAECSPAWTGDMGFGTAYMPGDVIDGVFYQRVGTTIWGFAAGCRSDGGPCDPDFLTPATPSSALFGVALHEGQLVLTPGDGSVYGFPEHCGVSCTPLWVVPISESLSAPTLAGDAVVFSHAKGVVALPLPCSDPCRPRWTANLGGYWSIDYADANAVVVTERLRGNPEIAVLPMECTERCEPTWSTTLDQKIFGVTSDGVHVFVTVGDEVRAYPIECTDGCEPVWRGGVSGETWWLLLDGSRLVAGSRAGGVFDDGIALTVFASTSGYADAVSGVSIDIPAEWTFVQDPQPEISDPRMLFGTATTDVTDGSTPCQWLSRITTGGAVVWLVEWFDVAKLGGSPSEFPPQPSVFELQSSYLTGQHVSPDGEITTTVGNAAQGQQWYRSFAEAPDSIGEKVVTFLADAVREFWDGRQLLLTGRDSGVAAPIVARVVETLVAQKQFHPFVPARAVVEGYSFLEQHLTSTLEDVLAASNREGDLLAEILKTPFSSALCGLYEWALSGEAARDAALPHIEGGLEGISREDWLTALKTSGCVLNVTMLVVQYGRAPLSTSFSDALIDEVRTVLENGSGFAEGIHRGNLAHALADEARGVFYKRLRDALIDYGSRPLSAVLVEYGHELDQSQALDDPTAAERFVLRVLGEIVDRQVGDELHWAADAVQHHPGLMESCEAATAEQVRDRLRAALESPREGSTAPYLTTLATALGVEARGESEGEVE